MSIANNLRELVIEHTVENGTTLTGITGNDDVFRLLRELDWLPRLRFDDYRLRDSVNRPINDSTVQRTVQALETYFAGAVTVRVEVEPELRPVADGEEK